ncbi:hypothetical protein TR51_10605 [Kitasatospora griseola]|uniref:Uncharacterized protein n=1 Tax=Kitasatospora griseola TaxID=2064 RepID=A0A0D0NZN3_KITGR|nr:hypothetical protein TR51_10605 [Kitasatospora griseola]
MGEQGDSLAEQAVQAQAEEQDRQAQDPAAQAGGRGGFPDPGGHGLLDSVRGRAVGPPPMFA